MVVYGGYSSKSWLYWNRRRKQPLAPEGGYTPHHRPVGTTVSEEWEVNMGSSSSSYAPKTIYLDVDGKVQKVSCFSYWLISSSHTSKHIFSPTLCKTNV